MHNLPGGERLTLVNSWSRKDEGKLRVNFETVGGRDWLEQTVCLDCVLFSRGACSGMDLNLVSEIDMSHPILERVLAVRCGAQGVYRLFSPTAKTIPLGK